MLAFRHHRKAIRALCLLLVPLLLLPILTPAVTHATEFAAAAEIDSYMSDLLDNYDVPGAAIALVKDGQIIYAKGYGVRNIATGVPVSEQTRFAIGSISKSFTALAVAQLADLGRINLDAPVIWYVPTLRLADPDATRRLTVRELLNQTSGIPRADDLWLPDAPASRQQIIDDLVKVNLTALPGQRFQYSNQNYVLLGTLIERITGQSWESYVQSHILDPLGMASADFDMQTMQRSDNHADAHVLDGLSGLMAVTLSEVETKWLSTNGPATGIDANVLDLARYAAFQLGDGIVNNQRIVSEAMLDEMHRSQVSLSPLTPLVTHQGYGMGWFTENYRGYELVEHSGDVKGYAANITLVPSENFAVVMLSNSQVMEAFRQAVRLRLVETMLGLTPTPDIGKAIDNLGRFDLLERKKAFEVARSYRLAPVIVAQLAGDYDGSFGQVHIALSNGRLFARPLGWAVIYELAPFAPDKVLYSPGTLSGSLVLTFQLDAWGRSSFYQDNVQVLRRIGG